MTQERGGPAGDPVGRHSPSLSPEELRSLVRGDVLVAGAGGGAAVAALAVLAMGRLGIVSEKGAATVVIVIAVVAGAACFFRFGSGPRALWRDRLIVIAPVFLLAAPGIAALHDLDAGPVVAMLSGAAGFGAAALLGAALAARRR